MNESSMDDIYDYTDIEIYKRMMKYQYIIMKITIKNSTMRSDLNLYEGDVCMRVCL